jgi:hypothetical protein
MAIATSPMMSEVSHRSQCSLSVTRTRMKLSGTPNMRRSSTTSGMAATCDSKASTVGTAGLMIPPDHHACARAVAVLAAATFADLGYADVLNMAGGLTTWKDAGLPTEDAHASI